ncbi:MAG: tetratricopeptide repeat protein [Ruminococcus sp.]|nr:tetratricopeptide repeat protein [Ruminococcus sp.]
MRRAYSFTKSIIFSFWAATAVVILKELISSKPFIPIESVKLGSVVAGVLIICSLVIRLARQIYMIHLDRKIRRIMRVQGVTPEVLHILRSRVDKARSDEDRDEGRLILASFLSEGCCYERCFEVLREIDVSNLSDPAKEEYFNVYVYTNLMIGDVEAAQGIYDRAAGFFDRARRRRSAMPVLHTMGALEYAKGNYKEAEDCFTQAMAYAVGKSSRCECEMFLSLCYLKTGRLIHAANAARAAARDSVTVYQRRSIEGLRAQIEEMIPASSRKETAV